MAMLRFWLIDDLYKEDEYGSRMIFELEHSRRLSHWIGRTLRPYVRNRVLEIDAGIGTLTNQLIPRDMYVASDTNPNYIRYLESYSYGKPYLHVMGVDVENPEHVTELDQRFDTALMLNVLERLSNDVVALKNIRLALQPGGRVVVVVPQYPKLMEPSTEFSDAGGVTRVPRWKNCCATQVFASRQFLILIAAVFPDGG